MKKSGWISRANLLVSIQKCQKKDMHIEQKTINEHFLNQTSPTGRGRFFKKIKEDLYADSW